MELQEIEYAVAELDALFAPTAHAPVDISDPDWMAKLAAAHATPLARQLGVADRTEAVLSAVIERYAAGDGATRAAIRDLFNRYTSFRWAAHLPRDWRTAADLRNHLIHLSARDQGADTRDELLALRDLLRRAEELGVDADPILSEVAAMSSDVDRYGMGSLRQILNRCVR
nr:hypothetical protein [Micromonospora sp. DSM 115978]